MRNNSSKQSLIGKMLRSLPHFRGKLRVARLVISDAVKNSRDVQIKGKYDIKYILPNIKEAIGFELFVEGVYEKGMITMLKESIPQKGVFIDVGANIGAISIPLARQRPDITIIAIEASPWIYAVLRENILANKISNIISLNNAVYNESGKELPMYAPNELFGKGSLSPIFTEDSELVTTITIDDLQQRYNLPDIDFVKIDVEGFEKCVFEGMGAVFKTYQPKIIFEFVDWAERNAGFEPGSAQSFILSQNYSLQKLNDRFKITGTKTGIALINGSANFLAYYKAI